jgi:NADH-quinone oxidoreductase subunit G
MINLTIDGQLVSVPKGTTVYHAAEQLGINIPIFCYHDRMPPFGACRMCLVQVEKSDKMQASCTLECSEGMVVSTQSPAAVGERKGILELLLINHPLDCPICDKGGECPLQDQTYEYGPGKSRFYEEKRHFKKQLPLGPVLMLDRERCIICARCTRFGDLVAGDHALEFVDRGFKTEVGTIDNRALKSKFIGNTISICPVGALTSQVYRFRARPWDNDSTPSSCTLCPVGCSMIFDERDGEMMRTRALENHAVNDVWLCDKGWFGYEFSESSERLKTPLIRRGNTLIPATWDEAVDLIADKMLAAKQGGRLAAIGGAPLTTEENFLWQKLMREGLGVNNVDYRVGMPVIPLDDEGISPGMEMEIGECDDLNFAILFGVDLTEEFPLLWLRLKHAINNGCQVVFAGHYTPEIAPYLKDVHLHPPGEELNVLQELTPKWQEMAKDKKNTAIFVGRQYLASNQRKAICSSVLNLKQQIPSLKINILEGNGNSCGARFAGMHPELSPLGERLQTPGLNALQVLNAAAKEGWDFLYVAGANPAAKFSADLWNKARQGLNFMVVQDLFLTETAQQADVVLPAFCYIEKGGHFTNIAGRMQELKPRKQLPDGMYSDGEIFTRLANKLGLQLVIGADFFNAVKKERVLIQKNEMANATVASKGSSAPTGQLFGTLAPALFDAGVRMKRNHHLVQLAKAPAARLHPDEAKQRKLTSGSVVQIHANGQTTVMQIICDPGVSKGTIVLPLGFAEVPISSLAPNFLNGFEVKIVS